MLFSTPKVGKRGFSRMTQRFGGYSGQLSGKVVALGGLFRAKSACVFPRDQV